LDGQDGVAGVDGADECCEGSEAGRLAQDGLLTVFALDGDDVGDLLAVHQRSYARHQVLSERGHASHNVREAALLDVLHKQRCVVLG
jgi:hypothetical protein